LITPVVELKGNYGEIGFQHGRQLKERVRRNVDIYMKGFHQVAGLDRNQVFARAEKVIKSCERYSHELVEELQGIAEGAGCHVFEILAVNARFDIIFSGEVASSSDATVYSAEGCTTAAALPGATSGGRTLIGQNMDWMPPVREGLVIQKIEPKRAPRLVTICEAGIIGKVGMNQAGIGICGNGLWTDQKRHEGVPHHFTRRKALQADTLAEAIGAICSAPRLGATNAMLARDGEALDLETSPEDVQILYPQEGVLAHSNNFRYVSPRFRDAAFFMEPSPSTFMRWLRVEKTLRAKAGYIDEQTFMKAFSDHFDYPISVCRHANPKEPEPRRWVTLFSVIMDLDARVMWFTDDNPCQGKYERLDFSDYLR
jgi:isopenicillin-N N-acyltransferase-like protein